MKENLDNFIRAVVTNYKEEEIAAILAVFKEKKFDKGDIFKQSGTISRKLGFIVSGSASGGINGRNWFVLITLIEVACLLLPRLKSIPPIEKEIAITIK